MSHPPLPKELQDFIAALKARRFHWMAPTLGFGFLALLYVVFFYRPLWEARQSLLMREEAASGLSRDGRPGRFDGLDAMKTAQETVLELAHSRAVAAGALKEVGPPRNKSRSASWPSQKDIEKLQDSLSIKAPQGAEFGKTEVFYLLVKDKDRQRALALTGAVADRLEERLQGVRNRKAASLVDELTRSVELARTDLDTATERLVALERSAGGDLPELRMLTDTVGGESNLRTALTAVKNDQRQARVLLMNRRQLLEFLKTAQSDPGQLLATPNDLLGSQPSLQKLKDGLVEAQLVTARLQGTMTELHPLVQNAKMAESGIRDRLHLEIGVAIRGIEAELGMGEGRMAVLDEQMEETKARMDRLVGMRAHYANAASEVRHCDELLKKSQQDLSAARGGLAASQTASLMTRLEEPYTANDPCGPRRAVILLCGVLGGFAVGLGIVFLLPMPTPGSSPLPFSPNEGPRTRTPEKTPFDLAEFLLGVPARSAWVPARRTNDAGVRNGAPNFTPRRGPRPNVSLATGAAIHNLLRSEYSCSGAAIAPESVLSLSKALGRLFQMVD